MPLRFEDFTFGKNSDFFGWFFLPAGFFFVAAMMIPLVVAIWSLHSNGSNTKKPVINGH